MSGNLSACAVRKQGLDEGLLVKVCSGRNRSRQPWIEPTKMTKTTVSLQERARPGDSRLGDGCPADCPKLPPRAGGTDGAALPAARHHRLFWALAGWAVAALVSTYPPAARPQVADFQVVWVVIGEAASGDRERSARAGRQLFMASDLMALSLENVRVMRVDVEPVVVELPAGERLCLSSLQIRAVGVDQQPITGAPLSVSIRQDQRQRLNVRRTKRDICLHPAAAGEYPVRLTSLLPAPDGTMRGAQLFVRVAQRREPRPSDDGT